MTSPDEVKSVLETLKIGKASGPDYINNYVLKMCAAELSEPLSKLFNYSLSQSKVPKIWKEANVTPVFKKDDPSDYRNYRPSSLLSTVAMVLGKLPVPGRPTILITVGQGPIALAVGRVGVVWTFLLSSDLSPLSPSLWETARYRLKYCLKGPLNQKQIQM